MCFAALTESGACYRYKMLITGASFLRTVAFFLDKEYDEIQGKSRYDF